MKEITFCSLINYPTKEELLIKEFFFSRNKLKKYLAKKDLKKVINKGDVISVPIDLMNHHLVNPQYTGAEVEVLYEDENIIVMNKPYNLHGHALSYLDSSTINNFVRSKFKCETLSVEDDEKGLLYRLDFVTSGVLIYSKSLTLLKKVRDSFSSVVKTKEYLAVVKGCFNQEGAKRHFLIGSGQKGKKVIESRDESLGKECHAYFKKLQYNKELDISLVQIELKTGFRHQIRSQLSILGFPILGDELYGGERADRVYLHAKRYIVEIDEKELEFIKIPSGAYWKLS